MVSRFGSAVMWLLLLALPLQGFAAATMLHCGPNHHRMMTAASAGPDETQEHAAAELHHHEMRLAAVDYKVPSIGHSGDAPPLPHLDKLVKFKCNACAVCCTGAALPTAIFAFDPFSPAIAPEFFVPPSHVGFVTDGPDRPPRLSHL